MDPQQILDVASRFAHVLTAGILLGGGCFLRFVLLPALAKIEQPHSSQLREGVLSVWKKFIHGGILVLLVSGFYNFFRQIPLHKGDALYHTLMGVKILLALGVFFLVSALVGKAKAFQKLRDNTEKWLLVVFLLVATIYGIGAFVKIAVPAKPAAVQGVE